MERIVYQKTEIFVPDANHLRILQAVADTPGCHISGIVQQLQGSISESRVRSTVRQLLSKRYLDGGTNFSESVTLRLTSSGRVLLQKAAES